MLLRKIVRLLRATPLDDTKVLEMAHRHGLKSINYETVAKTPITKLLPKPISGILVFFTDHSKPNKPIGHFCLLYRTPRTGVVFFDPLGNSLHDVLRITHNRSGLLKKLSQVEFSQNRIQYQKKSKDVQTCGRHCVCRWNAATLHAKEYSGLMHLPGMTADDIVTLLTLEGDLPSLLKRYTGKRR